MKDSTLLRLSLSKLLSKVLLMITSVQNFIFIEEAGEGAILFLSADGGPAGIREQDLGFKQRHTDTFFPRTGLNQYVYQIIYLTRDFLRRSVGWRLNLQFLII